MLTDTQFRNAKPADKPYKLTDGRAVFMKPNGTKAWRYRFELSHEGQRKESVFAIGDYAYVSGKETEEEDQIRRNGGRFTSAEARTERDRASIRRITANLSRSSVRMRPEIDKWL